LEEKANQLSERLLEYGAAIIRLSQKLETTFVGKHIAGQVFRSGTSAGANYEEACGAESRADFIHKLQIVLKELRETSYWLKLVRKASLIDGDAVDGLSEETKQLVNIIAKSLITAKKKK
jgi:four helix bundle protein